MELRGKIIDFLGDSITEGAGVEDVAANRFDNVLLKIAGLKAVNNYGVGGSRIAHQRRASEMPRFDLCFCGRAFDMDKSADVIVVFGGTNDYGHGDAPFGEPGDHGPATYCGAVNYLMDMLKAEYPDAVPVFLTPARRWGDELPSTEIADMPGKRPLKEYVDYIIAAGQARGISVLDLYRELPIDPNREDDKARYTADGLHLNDVGHHMLAELLKKHLESI